MLSPTLARVAIPRLSMLALFGLATFSVRAADLADNLGKTTSGSESVTVDRWLAASFKTDAVTTYQLSSVTLLLANPTAGEAELDLHSDGGLEPGAFIATLISPASFSITSEATTFSATGLALDANTTYWVVLRVLGGTFDWAWTADGTGSGVGFSSAWDLSEDAGAGWFAQDVYPLQLKVSATLGEVASTFRRGDTNLDGKVDISDPVGTLGFLFLGAASDSLPCKDAADSNDDGKLDLSDAVYTLTYKFLGGAETPAPGPLTCGADPTDDELPDCDDDPATCAE